MHAACAAATPHPLRYRYKYYESKDKPYQGWPGTSFNQPLSLDTSSVTDMDSMFAGASAFNQPLSLDTSSVTDMGYMFQVRSTRALTPSLQSGLPPCRCRFSAACAAAGPRPPALLGPQLAPNCMCPPFNSRQHATAFNQPLSLDTSSVTDMGHMFQVGSAYGPTALRPNLQSGLLSCMPLAPPSPHTPSPPPGPYPAHAHLAPHRMPSFRLGS